MKAVLEKVFEIRDTAHKYHLLQRDKKFATHNALNILYEEILELADTLSESYFGIYGVLELDWATQKVPDITVYIQDCYDSLSTQQKQIPVSYLVSQMDIILQTLAQTLYRLRHVQ